MSTPVVMPQLGETLIEGTLLRWLKQEGETVKVDEPLLEISTDKVDTEVPSPAAGILLQVSVGEGETVPVGTQLAVIAESVDALEATAADPDAPSPGSLDAETPGDAAGSEPAAPAPAKVVSAGFVPGGQGPRAHILSPLVRKLAIERGVDLARLVGTGAGGRITKRDVLSAVPGAAPAPSQPDLRLVGEHQVGDREELQPMTHVRKAIAQHMSESLRHTARAWTVVDVDMENIAQLRASHKDAFQERERAPLTYLPFIARATCEALFAHPEVNAALLGDDLLLHRYVNLGIAVAYDEGLIVPVIKDAHDLTIPALARAIADMATRARNKQLRPDDVQYATFTITNPGSFGSLMSVPIINQPNTGILSIDAVEQRPVVVDGAVVARHRAYVSMSWDHRVIDGAIATKFLVRIKEHLETWDFAEDIG